MLSEPMTLYKLMILYMLKQVKFPLTNSNISDFFVSKEYTTYFIVQQALSELLESNLLSVENINNNSRYEMTKEGKEDLSKEMIIKLRPEGREGGHQVRV